MEFVAKFDDQITPAAPTAASSLGSVGDAAKGADAGLKTLDEGQKKVRKSAEDVARAVALQVRSIQSAQKKSAGRAEVQAKAFDPEAFKRQIAAEQALSAAREKALQELGIGRSEKEKSEKRDAENAEKEKKRAKEQRAASAGAGASGLAGQVKAATLAFVGLAGAASLLDLSKIAIGFAGVGRLQMITQRATLNFRQLFKGVDSKPLERSLLRLTDMFSMSSVSGRAISGVLTRSFNGFFSGIERGAGYVETFFQTLLLGGLKAENVWLRARIGLVPFTSALGRAIDQATVMRVSAVVLAAGLGYVAVAAATAAAPFLAFAAAVAAAVAAFDQFSKLSKEWDTDLVKRSLGFGESDADKLNRKYDEEAAARKAAGKPSLSTTGTWTAPAAPGTAAPKAAGMQAGVAMGQGLVAGLSASEAAAKAAGGALAMAADAGVRAAADIHSPSRLFRKRARQMGQGEELGFKDSAPAVQRAAAESLVPESRGLAGGAPAGAAAGRAGGAAGLAAPSVINLHIGNIFAGSGKREEVQEDLHGALALLFRQAQIAIGGATT